MGSPPRDPVQCGSSRCNISSCYGIWPDRTPCTAAKVVYPTTEKEIVSAVAEAVQKKQKVKVVSRWAHSIPKLICPGGNDGLVISTRDYNGNLVIDEEEMTVIADSGVELRQLIDGIAAAGLALPYTPYWEGVSIGGLLSTGAHGSSFFQKGGAVHEYVTGMTLVVPATRKEGYAKVIELTEADSEELNAAKVSLGVLGVISKVRLQLEPMFKRSITNEVLGDADLEDRILPFASAHEFGDITWHPSRRRAVYKMDDRVSINVSGDGVNDFLGFRPTDVAVVESVRALESSFESTNNAEGKCISARLQVDTLLALGNGLKNNDHIFTGYPVIGYQNRLQASGSCLRTSADDARVCAWDSRAKGEFFHQTTVSIPVTKLHAFIQDVKALRDVDHKGLCGVDLYYGVYMRFVKGSSAFLGEQEDAVSVDITYYRAREGGRPRLLQDVLEEVEQMASFKYGGRPHWGKNRPIAFLGVWDKYPNLHRFLRVKQRFDPDGLFSSEWSDGILGISPLQVTQQSDGCALEGLCICSVDDHCAPSLGYLCQPGKVYREARVCRKVTLSNHDEL